MLTVVIHQGDLIIAHQPAKVEYQHGPTSEKPKSVCLNFAYILRAVSGKIDMNSSLIAYFITYCCKRIHQHRGNYTLDTGLSPDLLHLHRSLSSSLGCSSCRLLSQLKTLNDSRKCPDIWMLDELGSTICLLKSPDMLTQSLGYLSRTMAELQAAQAF